MKDLMAGTDSRAKKEFELSYTLPLFIMDMGREIKQEDLAPTPIDERWELERKRSRYDSLKSKLKKAGQKIGIIDNASEHYQKEAIKILGTRPGTYSYEKRHCEIKQKRNDCKRSWKGVFIATGDSEVMENQITSPNPRLGRQYTPSYQTTCPVYRFRFSSPRIEK